MAADCFRGAERTGQRLEGESYHSAECRPLLTTHSLGLLNAHYEAAGLPPEP